MAGVPDDNVTEVRSRIPIEDLVRDYNVQLLSSGGKRLRALCPFHSEKTPSFYVNVEQQFYHCFGCKEHGDIFTFVEKMDHVGFPEALEMLARRAGVTLRRRGRDESRGEKITLFDALALAEEFYHRMLLDDPRGAPGRRYLEGRKIGPEMWKRFRLGYSPPEWDALLNFAVSRKIGPGVLEKAGLVRAREAGSGFYDYFRGRVMFPISDAQKRVVGFGARALDDEPPKYLNTPKTALFEKGQVLYGLPQARPAIHREGRISIMEGYTDVIMAHQQGLEHAVASLGTAFTAENARKMRRLAPKVDLIFDGDAAGQTAAERSLDLLVAEDLEVRIYTVTHGKDPCDSLLELGGAEFRRLVEEESVDIFDFKWRRTVAAASARGEGPEGVARALDEVLALLARVPNPIARKLVSKKLAERLELEEEDLESRLLCRLPAADHGGRSGHLPAAADRGGRGAARGGAPTPAVPAPAGAPPAVGAGEVGTGRTFTSNPASAGTSVEEVCLECLLAEPDRARERLADLLRHEGEGHEPAGDHSGAQGRRVLSAAPSDLWPIAAAIERQLAGGELEVKRLLAELEGEEARAALLSILARLDREAAVPPSSREEVWKSCLRDLERKALERRSGALEDAKARARAAGDREGYLARLREQHDIQRRLKRPPGALRTGSVGGGSEEPRSGGRVAGGVASRGPESERAGAGQVAEGQPRGVSEKGIVW